MLKVAFFQLLQQDFGFFSVFQVDSIEKKIRASIEEKGLQVKVL
jgi:hypothetical protein